MDDRPSSAQCPSCGHENIPGEDRCVQCLHSLMQTDIPRPKSSDNVQSALMTTPVSDLLTGKDLLIAAPNDSILKVIQILQKKEKNCVIIYDNHRLVGILSNRDILHKIADKFEDMSQVPVSTVMTPSPEFLYAEDPIAFAINKMAVGGFRHIPVLTREGKPISIITINDVLKYLSKLKTA